MRAVPTRHLQADRPPQRSGPGHRPTCHSTGGSMPAAADLSDYSRLSRSAAGIPSCREPRPWVNVWLLTARSPAASKLTAPRDQGGALGSPRKHGTAGHSGAHRGRHSGPRVPRAAGTQSAEPRVPGSEDRAPWPYTGRSPGRPARAVGGQRSCPGEPAAPVPQRARTGGGDAAPQRGPD